MIKAIVTDIEGTTSSLSFVKDVLFPYSSANLSRFLESSSNNREVISIIKEILHKDDNYTLSPQDWKEAEKLLQDWIKLDLKLAPLKTLQGLIWEQGFKAQVYQGHIYDDAYQALKQWHENSMRLYIYSSGSVFAQKLLFGHTKYGDLNYLFSGYFDTTIGGKKEAASYACIAENLQLNPDEILFLSDIQEEIDAALASGLQVYKLVRDSVPSNDYDVKDFTSIKK